jgi:hypothetical protein
VIAADLGFRDDAERAAEVEEGGEDDVVAIAEGIEIIVVLFDITEFDTDESSDKTRELSSEIDETGSDT